MSDRRPSGSLPLPPAVCLGLGLFIVACAGGDDDAAAAPSYTRPSYATARNATALTPVSFTDVTTAAGIDFVHENGAFGRKWMPETMGSGAAFLDYDGDGWLDILLVNGTRWPGHEEGKPVGTPRLYRNERGGRFTDVTRAANLDLEIYGMGVTAADYDADGDIDIYLTAVGDNLLLRNDGGRFTDVTRRMGTSGTSERPGAPPAWSTGAAWVDTDRDGWLDLFVCNYVQWSPDTDLFTTLDGVTKSYATPQQYEGESCRLYRNLAGRGFRDVTADAGVLNHAGKSLGVALADFDDDGWPDIVVSNDTYQNFLYRNDGDGTFTDIALQAGVAFDEDGRARAGMGIDVADVRGDGQLSIAIGNFSREPLSLYTQIDVDLFQDRAGAARLTRSSVMPLTFGLLFVDANLDGFPDLVAGNGHIEPEINAVQQDVTFAQRPQIFLNDGQATFIDISDDAGAPFQQTTVARGVVAGDFDNDGDPDLLMTVNGGPPKLLRNELPPGQANWLKVALGGSAPNLAAIGAHVTVHTERGAQRQMVRTGSSYLSQSSTSPLVFGLADAAHADSILVRWPTSGAITRVGRTPANDVVTIRESDPAS